MAGFPVVVPSTEVPETDRKAALHRKDQHRYIVILKRGNPVQCYMGSLRGYRVVRQPRSHRNREGQFAPPPGFHGAVTHAVRDPSAS